VPTSETAYQNKITFSSLQSFGASSHSGRCRAKSSEIILLAKILLPCFLPVLCQLFQSLSTPALDENCVFGCK